MYFIRVDLGLVESSKKQQKYEELDFIIDLIIEKTLPLLIKGDEDIPLERKVVLQQQHVMNGKEYLVEFSFSKNKFIIIACRK